MSSLEHMTPLQAAFLEKLQRRLEQRHDRLLGYKVTGGGSACFSTLTIETHPEAFEVVHDALGLRRHLPSSWAGHKPGRRLGQTNVLERPVFIDLIEAKRGPKDKFRFRIADSLMDLLKSYPAAKPAPRGMDEYIELMERLQAFGTSDRVALQGSAKHPFVVGGVYRAGGEAFVNTLADSAESFEELTRPGRENLGIRDASDRPAARQVLGCHRKQAEELVALVEGVTGEDAASRVSLAEIEYQGRVCRFLQYQPPHFESSTPLGARRVGRFACVPTTGSEKTFRLSGWQANGRDRSTQSQMVIIRTDDVPDADGGARLRWAAVPKSAGERGLLGVALADAVGERLARTRLEGERNRALFCQDVEALEPRSQTARDWLATEKRTVRDLVRRVHNEAAFEFRVAAGAGLPVPARDLERRGRPPEGQPGAGVEHEEEDTPTLTVG